MTQGIRLKIFLLALVLILPSRIVVAAEINAFFPGAMEAPLSELIPQYEKSSGQKITPFYGSVGAVVKRLNSGQAADLVVVSDGVLAELIRQGKIISDGHATVAVVGISVFVRKGAVKPDISTVDAFKKALLAAKSIAYADPALGDSSAIYAKSLLERLGIAAEMKPKTVLVASRGKVAAIARGDAEIGFDQMSHVVEDPRVEPIGPLPAGVQHNTNYAGGVAAGSKQEEAVKSFIVFLRSPASQSIMKQKGFEPF